MHEWVIDIGGWMVAIGITGLALIGLMWVLAFLFDLLGGKR